MQAVQSMSQLTYEEMLERALKKLPTTASKFERFEVPLIQAEASRSRTVVHNFKDICTRLNRDPLQVIKFITHELATAGTFEDPRLVLQGKFVKSGLDALILRYTQNYVICPTCGRPDTKIVREDKFSFLQCEACGAKTPLKPL